MKKKSKQKAKREMKIVSYCPLRCHHCGGYVELFTYVRMFKSGKGGN